MRKIIENETTFGLVAEMLKIELNNDVYKLRDEYHIAWINAKSLLSDVESNVLGSGHLGQLSYFEEERRNEYQIARSLLTTLLPNVEPGNLKLARVTWFKERFMRGLPFEPILLIGQQGSGKDSAERKLYIACDGEKVMVTGGPEIALFILFQKCRKLACYPLYERRILSAMFKEEGFIDNEKSAIPDWFE